MFFDSMAGHTTGARILTGVVAALATMVAAAANGQCELTVSQRLTHPDPYTLDQYGYSVAVSGDWAVVGVPYDNDLGADSGSAYVFWWDGGGWVNTTQLYAPNYAAGDSFGYSVDIDGDYIIVGAPAREQDTGANDGAAFVFHYDGEDWDEVAELPWPDSAVTSFFGGAVSIDAGGAEDGDELALVGAYEDELQAPWFDAGSAWLYAQGDEWGLVTALIHIDPDNMSDIPESGDRFGYSVSVDGDVAVVGIPGDDEDDGAVFIFRKDHDGWTSDVTPITAMGIT